MGLRYKDKSPIDISIITESIKATSQQTPSSSVEKPGTPTSSKSSDLPLYSGSKNGNQDSIQLRSASASAAHERFYSSLYAPINLNEIDYDLISRSLGSQVKIGDNRYADTSFVLSKLAGVNPLRPELISLFPIDLSSIEKYNPDLNYFIESSDNLRKFLKMSSYSRNFRNSRIARVFDTLKSLNSTKKIIEDSNKEFIAGLADAKKAIDFIIGLFKAVDEFDDIYVLDEHKIDSSFFVQKKNNSESASSGYQDLKTLFLNAGYNLDFYNRISNSKKFLYALELIQNSIKYFPGLFLKKSESFLSLKDKTLAETDGVVFIPQNFKDLKSRIESFISMDVNTNFTNSTSDILSIFSKIKDFNLSERDSIVATCSLLGKDLSASYAMGNPELSSVMNSIYSTDTLIDFESSSDSVLEKTMNVSSILSSDTRDINFSSSSKNRSSVGSLIFHTDSSIHKTVYKLDKYFTGNSVSDYKIAGYDYYLSSIMNPNTFLDSSTLKSGYGDLSSAINKSTSIVDILVGNSKSLSDKQESILPQKIFDAVLGITKEFLSFTKDNYNVGIKLLGLFRNLKNDYRSRGPTPGSGSSEAYSGVYYKAQLFKYFILKNIARNSESDAKTQKKEFFELLSLVHNVTPPTSVDVSDQEIVNYLNTSGIKDIFPFYDKNQNKETGFDVGFNIFESEHIDWSELFLTQKEGVFNDQSDPFKSLGTFLNGVHDTLEKYYFYDGISNKVYTKYTRLEFIKFAALVFEMFVDFVTYLDIDLSIQLRTETSRFSNISDRYYIVSKYATILAARDAIDEFLKRGSDIDVDDPAFKIRQIEQEKLESIADIRLTVENEKLYAQYFRSNIKKIQELSKSIETEFLFTDKLIGFLKSFGQSINDKLSILSNYISSSGPNGDVIQFIKNENTSANLLNNWIYGFGGHQIRLSRYLYNRIVDFYNIDFENTESGFSSSYVFNPSITDNEEDILHKLIDSKEFIGLDKNNPRRVLSFGLPIGFASNVDQTGSSASFKFFESLSKSSSGLLELSLYHRNFALEGLVFKPKKYIFDLNLFVDKTKGFSDVAGFRSIEDLLINQTKYIDISNILEEKKKLGSELFRDARYTKLLNKSQILSLLKNHFYSENLRTMIMLLSGFRLEEMTFLINSNPMKSKNSSKFLSIVNAYIQSKLNQGVSLQQLADSNKSIASIISRIENNDFSNTFLEKVRTESSGSTAQVLFNGDQISQAFIEDMVDLSKMFSTDTWLFSPSEIRDKILYPKSFDRMFNISFSPLDFAVDFAKSDQEALHRILRSDDYQVLEKTKDGEYIYTQLYRNTSRFHLEQYYIDVRLLD